MDLAIAMTEQEVAKEMQLDEITDRPWHIQQKFKMLTYFYRASSAIEGFGVNEGINWLTEMIKRKKK